jgi:hypothetical protein
VGPEDPSVALTLTAGISDDTAGTVYLRLQCTAVPGTIEVPLAPSPIPGRESLVSLGHSVLFQICSVDTSIEVYITFTFCVV